MDVVHLVCLCADSGEGRLPITAFESSVDAAEYATNPQRQEALQVLNAKIAILTIPVQPRSKRCTCGALLVDGFCPECDALPEGM